MAKLWACCLLGVVALVLHELRPYKVREWACGFTLPLQAAVTSCSGNQSSPGMALDHRLSGRPAPFDRNPA